ncbi:MAG: site-2 protease family protein [Deltaproteobacteria bacterium]
MGGFDISHIIQLLVVIVPGFLLAITVHEFTHGYVALRFGDPTAKLSGRLTFNPISHLDPFGAFVLVVTAIAGFAIGWAKPVPVDPRYFRNPRSDMMWVSFGGPAANIVTAAVLAFGLHALAFSAQGLIMGQAAQFVLGPLYLILRFAVRINVVLAVFNLIPVPPLDGSKILQGLLPHDLAYQMERLEPYGFIILMLLIFTGVIGYLIVPPITFIEGILLGRGF